VRVETVAESSGIAVREKVVELLVLGESRVSKGRERDLEGGTRQKGQNLAHAYE
jgi:hypothetical protein